MLLKIRNRCQRVAEVLPPSHLVLHLDQQEGGHNFEVVTGRVNDNTADLEYWKSICYAAHKRDIGDECEEPDSKRPRTS